MVTCINDALYPGTGKAVVEVLSSLGLDIEVPAAQACCGQPMINSGYMEEAVPVVRAFSAAFKGYDAIVTPSASCAGSVRHQHSLVAKRSKDASLAAAVAEHAPRVYELSEFLIDVLGTTDVGASFPHRVAYHRTCHSMRMTHSDDRTAALLQFVRGIDLVEPVGADQCCGFGGTFAVNNKDVSVAMGQDKVRAVKATEAEVLVAADNSCLMHIGGLLSREGDGMRVMHLAEILAAREPVQ